MKVYVLIADDWEENVVIGVFSTAEKAEQYRSKHINELNYKYQPHYGYSIEDYEVDELLKGE